MNTRKGSRSGAAPKKPRARTEEYKVLEFKLDPTQGAGFLVANLVPPEGYVLDRLERRLGVAKVFYRKASR